MQIEVRTACEADEPAIRRVCLAAFGPDEGPEIVYLVEALRKDLSATPILELVATSGADTIGHILFTRALVSGFERDLQSSILAPLGVHPDHQGQGIGGKLIVEGLRILKEAHTELVFVLGHPGYYPRHGFAPAGVLGLEAPFPIPPENAEAWMVQELQPGCLGRIGGRVACANTLDDPKYWRE